MVVAEVCLAAPAPGPLPEAVAAAMPDASAEPWKGGHGKHNRGHGGYYNRGYGYGNHGYGNNHHGKQHGGHGWGKHHY